MDIRWIDTPSALDEAFAALVGCPLVAVDTEFRRETTFHAIPALVQLSDGETVWLVDPVAVDSSDAVRRVLGAEGPLKLIHACSEDLEVIAQWAGVLPEPMVDTQVAEALCAQTPAIGYQRLVMQRLDIELAKDATRSDWLARPLSERQRQYAALDVFYLPKVWQCQRQQLLELGRLDWLEADCARLLQDAATTDDFSRYYLRNRNAWKLSPHSLLAYQRLCQWRERAARERDIPRNWLASDGILFAAAEALPRHKAELAQAARDLKPSVIKRDGKTLLALIDEARQAGDDELLPSQPSPVSKEYRQQLKELKTVVEHTAGEFGISPEILARRRDLDGFLGHQATGTLADATLGNWRGSLLDDDLKAALAEENA